LVRALLEERDRGEREPAHAMERRIRQRDERRQLGCRRRKRYLLQSREERQLTFLLDLLLLRDRGLRPEAVETHEQARVPRTSSIGASPACASSSSATSR